MKKTLVAFTVLVMAAMAGNAQVYLGGSVGISTSSNKPDGGEKTTTTSWNVSPTVGYYLNDRFDIGIDLNLGSSVQKFPAVSGNPKRELTNNYWGVTPFARYSFFQVGRFEAIAKLGVNVGGGKAETKYPDNSDLNSSTKYTKWGIKLAPVLAYNLTDKVVLYTTSDFASLSYSSLKYKGGSTTNEFGLNADAGDLVNTGAIQIGFIYKF